VPEIDKNWHREPGLLNPLDTVCFAVLSEAVEALFDSTTLLKIILNLINMLFKHIHITMK